MQAAPQQYDRFAQLRADAQALSVEAFLAKYPTPMLIMEQHAPQSGISNDFTQETRGFKQGQVAGAPLSSAAVLAVSKRAGGDYDGRIYVGRETKADIVLEYPDVSRMHAYFVQSPERDTYLLTDAGSKNGTRMNGMHLVQGRAMPVRNGMRLMFGWRDLMFYMPRGLYHHLLGEPTEA